MNNKTSVALLKTIEEGSFKECNKLLKNTALPTREALKLLMHSANNVHRVQSSSEFTAFLKFLSSLEFDDTLENKAITLYIQSIYHIIEFLIKQEKYQMIGKLESLIVPKWIPKKMDETQLKYYKYCQNVLFNGAKNIGNYKAQYFLSLVSLIIDMEFMSDMENCVQIIHKVFLKFNKSLSVDYMELIYEKILNEIRSKSIDLKKKENFLHLLEILKLTITKDMNLKLVHRTIENLLKYFDGKPAKSVMEYFKVLLLLMSEPINQYGEINNFNTKISAAHIKLSAIFKQSKYFEIKCHLIEVIAFYLFSINSTKNTTIRNAETQHLKSSDLDLCIRHLKSQANIIKQRSLLFKCCCKTNIDIVNALNLYIICVKLINHNLKAFNKENEELLSQILVKLIEKYFEELQILLDNKCKYGTTYYESFSMQIVNLLQQIHREKLFSVNVKLGTVLMKIAFVTSEENTNYYLGNEPSTKNMYILYMNSLMEMKNFEDAMKICIVIANYYPEFREKCTSSWNIAKYETGNNWTMIEFLNCSLNPNKIVKTDGKINKNDKKIDKNDVFEIVRGKQRKSSFEDVLIFELNNYLNHWKAVSALNKTLTVLSQFNCTEKYLEVFVKIPFELTLKLGLKFNSSHDKIKDDLFQAIKHFYRFKTEQLFIMEKDESKMEKTETKMEKTESKNTLLLPPKNNNFLPPREEAFRDENEQYILPSRFIDMQFTKFHETLMKHLLKSLKHFELCKTRLTKEYLPNILDIIIYMASEFGLYSYEKEAKSCATLALNIANKFDDAERTLTSLNLLSKYAQSAERVRTLHLLGEKRMKNLEKVSEDLKANTLCSFYSHFAIAYLQKSQIEDYRMCYEKASDNYFILDKDETDLDFKKDLSKGYFYLLICKLDLLPCQLITDEIHGDDTLPIRHTAWKLLSKYAKCPTKVKNFPEYLSLFFAITENILFTNFWHRLPREIVCYGLSTILTAVTCFLPYRAAKLLIQLAKADVLCTKETDLSLKISYLEEISKVGTLRENSNLESISSKNGSPGRISKYTEPLFLSHEEGCVCLPCNSWDYQEICLEKIHLQACLEDLRENYNISYKFHQGVQDVYSKLVKKYAFRRRDCFLEASVSYMYHLLNRKKADTIYYSNIERFLNFQGNEKYRNYYVYNELCYMKIHLDLAQEIRKIEHEGFDEEIGDDEQQEQFPKTPEMAKSLLDPGAFVRSISVEKTSKNGDRKGENKCERTPAGTPSSLMPPRTRGTNRALRF